MRRRFGAPLLPYAAQLNLVIARGISFFPQARAPSLQHRRLVVERAFAQGQQPVEQVSTAIKLHENSRTCSNIRLSLPFFTDGILLVTKIYHYPSHHPVSRRLSRPALIPVFPLNHPRSRGYCSHSGALSENWIKRSILRFF
jgi:hypothetical protein